MNAQAGLAPVYLVREATHGDGSGGLAAAAGAGVIVVAAALCWALVASRARARRDPVEHAFVALCRTTRVGRSDRALVRRLARCHGAASPVALLLSEHAMRSALREFERGTPAAAEQRGVERLRRRCGL